MKYELIFSMKKDVQNMDKLTKDAVEWYKVIKSEKNSTLRVNYYSLMYYRFKASLCSDCWMEEDFSQVGCFPEVHWLPDIRNVTATRSDCYEITTGTSVYIILCHRWRWRKGIIYFGYLFVFKLMIFFSGYQKWLDTQRSIVFLVKT